jgi:hypothetical protein
MSASPSGSLVSGVSVQAPTAPSKKDVSRKHEQQPARDEQVDAEESEITVTLRELENSLAFAMNMSPLPGSEFDNEFEGDDLESLLSDDSDIAQTVAITFDASSGHGSLIVGKASELISGNEGFGSDCSYRIEYGTVRKDSSRHAIVVSFEGASLNVTPLVLKILRPLNSCNETLRAIPCLPLVRTLTKPLRVTFSVRHTLANEEDTPFWTHINPLVLLRDRVGEGLPILVHHLYQEASHETSIVQRYVYLHEDDPQGLKLLGLLSWPWSKKGPNGPRARFVFGFACQTCTCCGKKRHLVAVCKW